MVQKKYSQKFETVFNEIGKTITGNELVIERILEAILAEGHVLLEDIPGVGKTTMAVTFSRILGLDYRRIQFTPDTMPSDVVGFSMYHKEKDCFIYKAGAVMTNLLLADEINRTSSKTQAALLEVMEEGNTTVDGETHPLPRPFIVISTQNPFGYAGTQMLPQSQLDRFLVRLTMGQPDRNQLIEIMSARMHTQPMEQIRQVIDREQILTMQMETKSVHVSEEILTYIADLSLSSNEDPRLELGISPRGSLALMRMSQACAYLRGRNYVKPDDVKEVFVDTCAHRVTLTASAKGQQLTTTGIINEIKGKVKEPVVKLASRKQV